jgi:hypothetical protein
MINHVDFIGIGAPKAGTTLLASMLAKHPQIVLPNVFSGKEVNFFASRYGYDHYHKGLAWYYRQFEERAGCVAYGEISPSYFSDPEAPQRIQSCLPEVKLLAILRDPVKRAFSTYQQDKKACRIPGDMSFATAVRTEQKTLLDSYYSVHLGRYFDYFPRSQIHVLFLEHLVSRPVETCEELLDFLGVARHDFGEVFDRKVNEAWLPRSYRFQQALWAMSRCARAWGLQGAVHRLRQWGIGEWILKVNQGPAESLPAHEAASMAELFADENLRLCKLLGRTSLPWLQVQPEPRRKSA